MKNLAVLNREMNTLRGKNGQREKVLHGPCKISAQISEIFDNAKEVIDSITYDDVANSIPGINMDVGHRQLKEQLTGLEDEFELPIELSFGLKPGTHAHVNSQLIESIFRLRLAIARDQGASVFRITYQDVDANKIKILLEDDGDYFDHEDCSFDWFSYIAGQEERIFKELVECGGVVNWKFLLDGNFLTTISFFKEQA